MIGSGAAIGALDEGLLYMKEVRTYGQYLAHFTSSSYNFASTML